MKKRYDENCLGRCDFISFLTGAAESNEKTRIEQHLSHCGFCFEIFIGAFNQHLDHPLEPLGAHPILHESQQIH